LFWTKALQVAALDAHDPLDQTAPAHCPQKVRSKTICWLLMYWPTLQPVKRETGAGHLDGSGEALLMSEGMEPRGKK